MAAAIKAGAQVIVTANVRDVPDTALETYGIEAQTPDEFLLNLFDLEPELMVEIVKQQAADLRNPKMTVDAVLDEIAGHAPGFAAAVRDALAGRGAPAADPIDLTARMRWGA